ncbi:hypothetical protein DFH06DRAFT_920133, partial [Mycena polygramma]
RDPTALYPSDSTIFSATTFEFGGPHCLPATPDRYEPDAWSVLTALGTYSYLSGGHVIIWDLGLVISFPAGSSILIPTGLLRYSFVKVREGETRYSMLQWAGAGVGRWFANGERMDADFGARATE